MKKDSKSYENTVGRAEIIERVTEEVAGTSLRSGMTDLSPGDLMNGTVTRKALLEVTVRCETMIMEQQSVAT